MIFVLLLCFLKRFKISLFGNICNKRLWIDFVSTLLNKQPWWFTSICLYKDAYNKQFNDCLYCPLQHTWLISIHPISLPWFKHVYKFVILSGIIPSKDILIYYCLLYWLCPVVIASIVFYDKICLIDCVWNCY